MNRRDVQQADHMSDASNGTRDFFVSFNQADRVWTTWIAWSLEEAGYSVFFQDWDFKGNFVLEMDRAHQFSRRTVAVLSPDYITSRFAAPEWAARFAQDATSEHDLLIPIRVRPCELEGMLAQVVYVDLVGCGETDARERLLKRLKGIRLKPDEAPLFPGRAGHESVPERPAFPADAQPWKERLPRRWYVPSTPNGRSFPTSLIISLFGMIAAAGLLFIIGFLQIVDQDTRGDNSPAISDVGGGVTIIHRSPPKGVQK